MAVTFHTVTGNLADIGLDVDPSRCEVLLLTSLPAGEPLFDLANNRLLLGSKVLDVSLNGAFEFTVPATDSADVDPTGVQYQLRIKYPNPALSSGRDVVVLGWFDLDGAGPSTLTSLVESSYVPVNFLSQAVATLQALIDQAEAAVGVQDTDEAVAYALEFGADSAAYLGNQIATRLAKAANLADLVDPAAARTNLSLGTAATVNTGTASGDLPLLSTGGRLPIARLASGTPDGSKFLRDDGALATPPAGGTPLAVTRYNPGSGTTISTASGTAVDADATNLAVTFTVPASGAVEVYFEAMMGTASNPNVFWSLRSGAADVAGSSTMVVIGTLNLRLAATVKITGLTPGASLTYKWAHRTAGSGTTNLYVGGTYGAAVMKVVAA